MLWGRQCAGNELPDASQFSAGPRFHPLHLSQHGVPGAVNLSPYKSRSCRTGRIPGAVRPRVGVMDHAQLLAHLPVKARAAAMAEQHGHDIQIGMSGCRRSGMCHAKCRWPSSIALPRQSRAARSAWVLQARKSRQRLVLFCWYAARIGKRRRRFSRCRTT